MTNSDRTATGIESPPVTLTDFLLARIAEDEGWARRVGDAYLSAHGPSALIEEPKTPALFSRVLAECEAKRRIVAEALLVAVGSMDVVWVNNGTSKQALYPNCLAILRALALPYADHSDYRDEWRG